MTKSSNCPVCERAEGELRLIELQITTGTKLEGIAAQFRISVDSIIAHIQHGSEGVIAEETDEKRVLPSTANDEYSILRYALLQLRNRFTALISVEAATAESKELISLSKAISENIKTIVVVKEKLGVSDDTRMRQLEKQIDELMMVIPELCTDDQAKIERVLGIAEEQPLASG